MNGRTKGNFTLDELKERTRVKEGQDKREKDLDAKLREAEAAKKEQVLLKAKVGAEKEQLDKDKADFKAKEQQFNQEKVDFQAEKQAQEQTFKQERESIKSQRKENEQVAEQNKVEAQKIAQAREEVFAVLKEVKDLKFYLHKIISQMQEIKVPIKGVVTRVGDYLSTKFNTKEADLRQERLASEVNDKLGNQENDVRAFIDAHDISNNDSTEDTHEYWL